MVSSFLFLENYYAHVGFFVTSLLGLLVMVSSAATAIIFQRGWLLYTLFQEDKNFNKSFWASSDLNTFYFTQDPLPIRGIQKIFQKGFDSFLASKNNNLDSEEITHNVKQVMHHETEQELEAMKRPLSYLTTLSYISPCIGLLGTLWGIMRIFYLNYHGVSVSSASIYESLLLTAVGLGIAIVAFIGATIYTHFFNTLRARYDHFHHQFLIILARYLEASDSWNIK